MAAGAVCPAPAAAGFCSDVLAALQGGVLTSGAGMWSLVAGAGEEPCWDMFPLLGCGCDLDEVREQECKFFY